MSEDAYKSLLQGSKSGRYATTSAFIRAAIDKELRGTDSSMNESEQRLGAFQKKNAKEIQRVRTGQHALFAYVDALAKVILSSLSETDEDGKKIRAHQACGTADPVESSS